MKLHKPGVLTLTATAAIGALLITSCSSPTGTDSSGNDNGLVLADGYELGGYNPVAGFGAAGEAKMYDGLVRLTGGTGMPGFEPSLAAEMPTANADATVWTVKLRDGVTFSDGSTFDAADVVATYKAILDPASASEARSSSDMISDVVAVDDSTVEFRLAYSYAPLLTKMLIGMVPSESLATPGLAAESPLNTAPVGTGPYTLVDLSPDRAVFEANENYWDGAPEIKKLTLLYVPDDNTRAQRMVSGEIDGTNLPPLLANAFSGKDNMSVTAHQSADWRGLTPDEQSRGRRQSRADGAQSRRQPPVDDRQRPGRTRPHCRHSDPRGVRRLVQPERNLHLRPDRGRANSDRSGLDRRCRRNPFERRSAGAVHDHVQLRRHRST
ncbi:hypothetical protein GCM10020255_053330 [Rhodococcus baikonurensis]